MPSGFSAFSAAMDDDFDTAEALRLLYAFLKQLRTQLGTEEKLDSETCKAAATSIRRLVNLIGIDQI